MPQRNADVVCAPQSTRRDGAMIVACDALVVGLGGVSYAAGGAQA